MLRARNAPSLDRLPNEIVPSILSFLSSADALNACRYLFSARGSAVFPGSLQSVFREKALQPFLDPAIQKVETFTRLYSYSQVTHFICRAFALDLDTVLDRLIRHGLTLSVQWSRLLSRYPAFLVIVSWKGLTHSTVFGPYEMQRDFGHDPVRSLRLLALRGALPSTAKASRATFFAANVVVSALVWRARHRDVPATAYWVGDDAPSCAGSVMDAESLLSETPSLEDLIDGGDGMPSDRAIAAAQAVVGSVKMSKAFPPPERHDESEASVQEEASGHVDALHPQAEPSVPPDVSTGRDGVQCESKGTIVGAPGCPAPPPPPAEDWAGPTVSNVGGPRSKFIFRDGPKPGQGGSGGAAAARPVVLSAETLRGSDGAQHGKRLDVCDHMLRTCEMVMEAINKERTLVRLLQLAEMVEVRVGVCAFPLKRKAGRACGGADIFIVLAD